MKKILLTVVLGVAVSAVAQNPAQPSAPPAQGQTTTPPAGQATPPAPGQAAPAPGQAPRSQTAPGQAAPGQATPAPGQAAAPAAPAQAPVIKDPAEYNAYVAAVQQK